jgi:type VI secretion system protein ImpJ
MRALSRIVWSEGMHLAQHHFQAQTAYFENVTRTALSMLFGAPWGVAGLQLDDEALLNGTASLVAARGVMPDGMVFSFPEDALPEPVRVAELFSPTQASHLLLLALPSEVPGRANCAPGAAVAGGRPSSDADGSSPGYRFSAEQRVHADETTGGDERPVDVARKNFRLLLDTQPRDDLVTLPLARIRRNGAGQFIYDPEFIGPCLKLAGSRRLVELVARVVDMLEARSDALRADGAGGGGVGEHSPREVTGFWFLHAVNTAVPPLRHALQTGEAHPEAVYIELARLAGALCTFSLASHPRELPAYDHGDPEPGFRALERHIRRHLDVILPTDALTLPLERTAESFYRAPVADRRCLEPSARWYLGVRSSAPGADVVARVPGVVKVCSARVIAWLVNQAYGGLAIEHVVVAPAELSPRIGMHYFALRRAEPCWADVVSTGEVGMYVPASIPDAELELKVVLERRD